MTPWSGSSDIPRQSSLLQQNKLATSTFQHKQVDNPFTFSLLKITKQAEKTMHQEEEAKLVTESSSSAGGRGNVSLQLLTDKMADFAKERDWDKFHSPRNLLLAMVGEVGELSEIFQWKGEVERGLPGWDEAEKVHLGEELSDVLLYLVRLSNICGIDLGQAALRKMEVNAKKYPVDVCNGSSNKYTKYGKSNSNNLVINAGKASPNDDKACGAVGGV